MTPKSLLFAILSSLAIVPTTLTARTTTILLAAPSTPTLVTAAILHVLSTILTSVAIIIAALVNAEEVGLVRWITKLGLIIFKGKELMSNWISASSAEAWKFTCMTGWTNNIHGSNG
jgi:hypothetical protein